MKEEETFHFKALELRKALICIQPHVMECLFLLMVLFMAFVFGSN